MTIFFSVDICKHFILVLGKGVYKKNIVVQLYMLSNFINNALIAISFS